MILINFSIKNLELFHYMKHFLETKNKLVAIVTKLETTLDTQKMLVSK